MPATGLHIEEIAPGTSAHTAALALREAILRRPLGLAFTAQEMDREAACIHLVARFGGEVVATLLLQPLDEATVQMRQVAVRADLQSRGIGAQMLEAGERAAAQRGYRRLIAHARATALAFYERHGYAVEGDPFLEATIPHRLVSKALHAAGRT